MTVTWLFWCIKGILQAEEMKIIDRLENNVWCLVKVYIVQVTTDIIQLYLVFCIYHWIVSSQEHLIHCTTIFLFLEDRNLSLYENQIFCHASPVMKARLCLRHKIILSITYSINTAIFYLTRYFSAQWSSADCFTYTSVKKTA